jgi:hypothetical protein
VDFSMTTLRRAVGKNRGVAVLLALFFMILLAMIGIALIGMVPVELRSSTRTKLDLQAHYAVTSGIRHARSWASAVMTPSTNTTSPDFLGDTATTTGNSFYNPSGSFLNEITGVSDSSADVEYQPMRLADVFGSTLIPTGTTRWTTSYEMLNIPATGPGAVNDQTVVLVKKTPLQLGDWSSYVVIIPDADTPGGINTQTGGKITSFFGGAGKAGRRCYQIVSIAFYQGFPTSRGKSTVLEDSFARYSLFVDQDPTGGWALQALPGQTTTLGPVHSNGALKFSIDPDVWTDTSGTIPFNGLLTFGKWADASDGVDTAPGMNPDGAVYFGGNEAAAAAANLRPFDSAGAEVDTRYSKMIAGGKSNLRQTAPVALPPDSTKISSAAYGSNFVTSKYTGAVSTHVTQGGAPDGIFVFPSSTTSKAAGGVVLKGDQKHMFLEVVDSNGRPQGVDRVDASGALVATANASELSGLEAGTATGNPAIRAQAKTAITSTSFQTNTSTVTGTSTILSTATNLSTTVGTGLTTITSSTSTGTSISLRIRNLSGTSTTISTITSTTTRPLTTVSTIRNTTTTTRVTTTGTTIVTTGSTTTVIGGAGAGRQTIYLTSTSYQVTTVTGTTVNTTITTSTTGTTTGLSTRVTTIRNSSSTGRTTTTFTNTLYSTNRITSTTTGTIINTVTSVSTSLTYTTFVSTSVATLLETWRPMDQLIEAKNVDVNLSPTMFANNADYLRRPAGAHGAGADMDTSKLSGITQLLNENGTPLAATTVGQGNVVVIKQSRINPKEAVVFIIPATPNEEGALLNGAVYAEGSIGDPGNPASGVRGSDGLAGVNFGRRTIGGHIKTTGATPTGELWGPDPGKDSTPVGIVNNLWQYGTKKNETNTDYLKAEHGLGVVAEDIRINARPDDFLSFWNAQTPDYNNDKMLNIHAVMLGGSQAAGGLTINGFTDINAITPTSLGSTPTQTPLIRFVGGLILRNYYARVNAVTQAGWNSKNLYNQQLALKPPPFFPNNGLLIPLSYVEERIWAEQR